MSAEDALGKHVLFVARTAPPKSTGEKFVDLTHQLESSGQTVIPLAIRLGGYCHPMSEFFLIDASPFEMFLALLIGGFWVAWVLLVASQILWVVRNAKRVKVTINLLLQLCTVAGITFAIHLAVGTILSVLCCVVLTNFVLRNQ